MEGMKVAKRLAPKGEGKKVTNTKKGGDKVLYWIMKKLT